MVRDLYEFGGMLSVAASSRFICILPQPTRFVTTTATTAIATYHYHLVKTLKAIGQAGQLVMSS